MIHIEYTFKIKVFWIAVFRLHVHYVSQLTHK